MERLGGWKFFSVFWDGERESYGFFVRGNSGIGDGRMGCFRVVRVYRALFFFGAYLSFSRLRPPFLAF